VAKNREGLLVLFFVEHELVAWHADYLPFVWICVINHLVLISVWPNWLLLDPLVDDGHILQIVDVAAFYDEYGAADFEDVTHFQRV